MAKQPAITLLIKPASGSCNLRCRYCFYADEMNIRSERTYGMMSLETLDTLVEKTLNQVTHMATFAFQGGEPTLAGLDFYRSIAARYGRALKPGGWLCFEFGMGQGDDVCSILAQHGYEIVERTKDFNNIERAVLARKPREEDHNGNEESCV